MWRRIKMLDFETLREANRLGSAIPGNMEKLSSYEVDWGHWAVSGKIETLDFP